MLKGIDHIVVVVPDLHTAITSYGQLGFTVVPGGKHPIGTHNALVAFADGAYIELIAFMTPPSPHPWYVALEKGGGLVDFCLQTDDLHDDLATFRRAGVKIGDPAPLTRERPDGYRLSWVLSIPEPPYNGIVPFLIEDETPRDERVPRQHSHANGVTGIGTLTVAVDDLAATRKLYTRVLGNVLHEIRRDDLDAAGFGFQLGPHTFEFVAPNRSPGPLAHFLRTRRPAPYAATLKTTFGRKGPLDPALTLGARLALV